jgi:hypothetical protein
MSQQPYADQQLDRSEMFAIGAAAGAIITAAISEYLERRKPQTPLEKAQARGAELLDTLAQTKKSATKKARKQAKQTRKDAIGIKDAAVGALGLAASAGVIDKVRDYASSTAERVVGDPYAVSGSLRETIKERLGSGSDGHLSERAREISESTLETLKNVASSTRETIRDAELGDRARVAGTAAAGALAGYTATARERLRDLELGDKTKDYSSTIAEAIKDYSATARETIKDAHLGEKAKDYSALVSETVKDYADTIKDAKLGEKAKDYASVAGAAVAAYSAEASKTAKQSAGKLSENASHLAHAASDQAADVRKGVRKGVRRTRRRARWGLRSFVVGLVVGLLSAPQSGERTRDAITSFVENLLDVFMPDDQQPGRATSI